MHVAVMAFTLLYIGCMFRGIGLASPLYHLSDNPFFPVYDCNYLMEIFILFVNIFVQTLE